MLTKNWFAWMNAVGRMKTSGSPASVFIGKDGSEVSMNADSLKGSSGGAAGCQWLEALTKYANENKADGVSFGSGTATPTIDDYDIENIIVDLQVQLPSAPTPLYGNNYTEYRCVYSVTATTECTITEIGLTAHGVVSSSNKPYYLVDHTMLDTPIHLNAGESTNITYTFRFYH